jgi:Flp pilus assembly protein TadG
MVGDSRDEGMLACDHSCCPPVSRQAGGRQVHRFMARARRRDDGAAAVEFALLLPIFVMLVFGVISTGLSLWKHSSDVQAARDAARYGSTLSVLASGTDTSCDSASLGITGWLQCVQSVAIREAGWTDATNVGSTGDNGYVCVAYMKDLTAAGASATIPSQIVTAGTANPDDPVPPTSGTSAGGCFPDGRSDGRVQVYIRRDGDFNAVFYNRTWMMPTQVSIPYERGTP